MPTERLKFATIVGARPQFVKAAVVSRAIRMRHDEIIVHTGQHYDAELSSIFFDELSIPLPDVALSSGSGTHAEQTAAMLVALERELNEHRPDWVVTFGDTNSTLAGALAAAKLGLKVAHIEAGLRSFNRRMAEEINRVVVDHLSSALLCPSDTAVANLAREGISRGVHLVGDVMAEAFELAARAAHARSGVLSRFGLRERAYLLTTIHRAENTDDPARLRAILDALAAASEPVLFPIHPRTRRTMAELRIELPPRVRVVDPLGYLDMIRLLISARLVLTDSGGLQKEAYWARVPCVTLRDETEWVETVAAGWNVVAGAATPRILEAVAMFEPPAEHPPLYGGCTAAADCVRALEQMSISGAA